MKPFVTIITGPCAAGKSTISKELATNVKRSAYIEFDSIRRMIKNGYVNPFIYTGEPKKQIDLATNNTAQLALNFLKAKFNVFIDETLAEKQRLITYLEYFKNYDVHIFLLLPSKEILLKRDKQRQKGKSLAKRIRVLHDLFVKRSKEENWHTLDTSKQTIKQTKKEILEILNDKIKNLK